MGREIGILRAIGLSRWRVLRCYVHEALLVVVSSVLMGLIIGTVLGWTMSAQRILFSQLPIPFSIPWRLFLVMFGISVILAFFAALWTLRKTLWFKTPVVI